MPRLVVEKGVDKGKSIPVNTHNAVVVGRDTSAGISIGDTMASRNHFKIEARNGGFVLVDLNSKNGTLLNGSKIKEAKIQAGDRIQVGETVLSFMEDVKPKEDLVGRIVGRRYKVLERIGRGGMGTVYRAEQIRLNRFVALKMLQQEHVSDPTFIKKFLDEARAAAQFNHPNVVTIYEIDVDNEMNPPVPFIAMEYLPGGSVQDMLSKEKRLAPEKALQVILDAARGLEYAEKKAIVHRDIKPDNLMIAEDGRIKIGDLGLAKSLKGDGDRPEVPEGVFGTPHYIAPEQALNKPIDIRADIYALGATFYRILAGTTPYQGATVKEIIVNKLKDPPAPLDVVNPEVPKPLVAIVDRMMKKDPAERYPTVRELLTELDRARRELTGSMTGPLTPSGEVSSSSSSATASAVGGELRRPATPVIVLSGAAAMLLVTVGVVGITLYNRSREEGGPQPGPTPPVVDNDGDTREKTEEIAKKVLLGVEIQQKNAKMTKVEDVRALIEAYSALVEAYPDTEAAKKASETIVWLNGHLNDIAADAVWGFAEEAGARFERFRADFAAQKAPFESVVKAAEAAMGGYNELVTKFPKDKRVPEAQSKLSAVDKALDRFRRAQTAWEDERRAVTELVDKREFGLADARAKEALKSEILADYDLPRRELVAAVARAAEAAYNDLVTQIETRRQASDFAGARELVTQGRAWAYPPFTSRFDDRTGEIDAAERDWRGAEAAKRREAEVAVFREARLRGLDAALARYAFGEGRDLLKGVVEKISEEDLRLEARAWISDFDAAAKAHDALMRRLNDKSAKAPRPITFEKIKTAGTPIGAGPEIVTVELQAGATVTIKWKDIKSLEYRLLMRLFGLDFQYCAGLVAADLILGLLKESETDLIAAEKEAQSPEEKAQLTNLRARAAWARTSLHESEAADRLAQARWEIQRSRWETALADLNEISTRLNSTKFYADHRAEIDSLAESCRDKIRK